MSTHGDQILFEILEELREFKKFLMKDTTFPTTLQELEEAVAAEIEAEEQCEHMCSSRNACEVCRNSCTECGAELNEGEAKTFTVCEDCWDKNYK